MKIRSDSKTESVVLTITAREAMSLANRLVKAAIASAPGEDWGRQEPTSDESMEREG